MLNVQRRYEAPTLGALAATVAPDARERESAHADADADEDSSAWLEEAVCASVAELGDEVSPPSPWHTRPSHPARQRTSVGSANDDQKSPKTLGRRSRFWTSAAFRQPSNPCVRTRDQSLDKYILLRVAKVCITSVGRESQRGLVSSMCTCRLAGGSSLQTWTSWTPLTSRTKSGEA